MEDTMVKENTGEANAEKTEESEDPFQYVVDIIQGVFDTIKEIPRFFVWGKSGLYTVEEAAKMRTSMRAMAKLANSKLLENAQGIAERAQTANKKFAGVSLATSVLGIVFDSQEIYDAWNKDEKSQTDKILTTVASSFSIGKNATYLVQNMQTLLSKLPKELGDGYKALGKVASGFKIASGAFNSINEIISLSEGNLAENEQAKSICDLSAGILDIAGGILEFTPLAPVAIPLGVMSAALSWAGDCFKDGQWGMGYLIIGVGTVLSGIMLAIVIAFKSTIMATLQSLMTSLSVTVTVTLPWALPILATIGMLILDALSTDPPELAQGGFPAAGQLFICPRSGAGAGGHHAGPQRRSQQQPNRAVGVPRCFRGVSGRLQWWFRRRSRCGGVYGRQAVGHNRMLNHANKNDRRQYI